MKRPFLLASTAIISLLLCTGCFDLEEYLFLKKDGSGKFSFVVNMSKMMAMAQMFEDSTETKKVDENEKLNTQFERSRRKIATIQGISNYQEIADSVNYRFGFSFEFRNIQALNKALNYVFASDSSSETNYSYFEWKDNQLSRLEPTDVRNLVSGSTAAPDTKTGSAAAKKQLMNLDMVFSDITYNTTYEFEQPIDSVANDKCLLAPKGNKVILTCHPFARDSASLTCSLKNKIFLK